MKKLILIITSIICSISIEAKNDFQKLLSVNQQWIHHQQNFEEKSLAIDFEKLSSTQIIQQHLLLVYENLSKSETKNLSNNALANRKYLLNQLFNYAMAGKFPINAFLPYTNPVFIDDYETHCAVGYLMQQSGAEYLAQEINATERFDYIKDISNSKVNFWALENGFTIDELAWIQPGYPAIQNLGNVSNGVDGAIHCILKIDSNSFIIGGEFTKELQNNTTCNHIALVTYNNNIWQISAMQNGVNGIVRCLLLDSNNVLIGGDFTNANGVAVQNIAQYNLLSSGQTYSVKGSLDSSVFCFQKYNGKIYAGGAFNNLVKYWQNGAWQNINNNLTSGGVAKALEVYDTDLYIGGQFDILTGAPRKNIIKYNTINGMEISHFGCATPVNDFCVYNNELYAGCTFVENTDTCQIAKLTANEWLTLSKVFTGSKINKLITHGGDLYVLGKFDSQSLMYSGTNISKIGFVSGFITQQPILSIDDEIMDAVEVNSKLLLVGHFINNNNSVQPPYTQLMNRIAYLQLGPSVINDVIKSDISFYPNPATENIYVSLENPNATLEYFIYAMNGNLMKYEKTINKNISIANLPNSCYKILIKSGSNKKSSILVKH